MPFSKYKGRRKGTRRSFIVRLGRRVKRRSLKRINRRYWTRGHRGC